MNLIFRRHKIHNKYHTISLACAPQYSRFGGVFRSCSAKFRSIRIRVIFPFNQLRLLCRFVLNRKENGRKFLPFMVGGVERILRERIFHGLEDCVFIAGRD